MTSLAIKGKRMQNLKFDDASTTQIVVAAPTDEDIDPALNVDLDEQVLTVELEALTSAVDDVIEVEVEQDIDVEVDDQELC